MGALGVWFRPCKLINREVLLTGEDSDPWESIVRVSFELPGPLGFEQPCTHVKVRRPNSLFRGRTYSITSRADEIRLTLTVKVYRGGCMSVYLGKELAIGEVAFIARTRRKPVLLSACAGLISFGVGVTEMVHTARQLVAEGREVRLLCAYRHAREALFKEQFDALAAEFPDRFRWMLILSQDKETQQVGSLTTPKSILHGRFDVEAIRLAFGDWKGKDARFLPIGSKPMMRDARAKLATAGFPFPLLGKPAW
eukprot:jgi/Mesvir1/22612/Mv14057-RA.1